MDHTPGLGPNEGKNFDKDAVNNKAMGQSPNDRVFMNDEMSK